MLLAWLRRRESWLVFGCLSAVGTGCGGRTPIPYGDGTIESPCHSDDDCKTDDRCEMRECSGGFCQVVSTVQCDDGDECTTDRCVPMTGQCEYSPLTRDEDGDGHRAVTVGKTAGDVGACGDDCDDTNANAYPGGSEVCDGADNDCNGVTDDSVLYSGIATNPVRVSYTNDNESVPAGFTFANGQYALTSVQRSDRWHGYFQSISSDGAEISLPVLLTPENSDAMAGSLVWTGAVYGTAWEDRRDESYDIYFNRLDAHGNKLGPDVRLTENSGFSVSPALYWNGSEWLMAYSDQADSSTFRIYVRRLAYDGTPRGEARALTGLFSDARSPRWLRTDEGLSLVYNAVGEGYQLIGLDDDLAPTALAVTIAVTEVENLSVRYNGDRYLVAWTERTETIGRDVFAMALDRKGQTIVPTKVIASGATMARSPTWLGLGDRAYLVWADDYQQSGVFELSGQMFDNDLVPLDERMQLTFLGSETFDPSAVLGDDGMGVVFRSRTVGAWQTYFLKVGCPLEP